MKHNLKFRNQFTNYYSHLNKILIKSSISLKGVKEEEMKQLSRGSKVITWLAAFMNMQSGW